MFKPILRPLAIILCLAAGLTAFQASATVNVGETAPNFTGTDANGKKVSLSDYEGQIVVLEWTNPGCPFVEKHYKSGNMQSLQKSQTGKGVAWLSINSSAEGNQGHMTQEEAKALIGEQGIASTAYILDASGEIGHLYGAKTTPHMYVIDTEGKVAYAGAIDSISSVNEADIPHAQNYVLTAINEVKGGTKPLSIPSTIPYGCAVKY